MANEDPTVIGLFLVKLNGLYEMDVKSGSYSARRALTQHVTGKGIRNARGLMMPSGSLEEVIPREGATDWKTLKGFTMEWVDYETKATLCFFEGCDWEGIDGRGDLAGPSFTKSISWKGTAGSEY